MERGIRSVSGRGSTFGPIYLASVRDLQWRSRRFILAALATGLVFSVTLMMSGVSNSFGVEIENTVNALNATSWLVKTGDPGPFTDPSPFPVSDVAALGSIPGVTHADPLFVGRALTSGPITGTGVPTKPEVDINILGVVPGGVGSPKVAEGSPLANSSQAVVGQSLGAHVGQEIALNGLRLQVTGIVDGVTYFAGQPVAFVTIGTAQKLNADGVALATAVLLNGVPTGPVPGFSTLTDAQVRSDLGRPTNNAAATIKIIEYLLWVVAAGIIGAIIYLSAIERRRDFAVLRAVGTPSSHLFIGLVLQAVLLALVAGIIGIIIEIPMSHTSQIPVRVSPGDYIAIPVVAIVVGVVASLLPARQAARTDPAIAFSS
jgi:putative ABC transport system permease protein